MRGLSTLTEVLNRGEIIELSPSNIKPGVWIVTFKLGDQANINEEVYKQLNIE